ncbi:hypothetical protein Tco_0487930 [Tanacetum coccineum]
MVNNHRKRNLCTSNVLKDRVNPSSRRCERKLQNLYADTRSLMARENGVDPDKIPYYVMWNISVWKTLDDDDDARSLWSSDDDEHFDPFEDDPTHPDACWRPLQDMLALTFHGRKGLPAYSRIALLDIRFVEYQHAGQDNAGDALLIDIDSNATPTCTYVPKQLSQDELVKLIPEKWITNYEQIYQAPVRLTSAPEFMRHENDLVEIKFSSSQPNCVDEAAKIDDDEDLPKNQKSSQQKLKRRYEKEFSALAAFEHLDSRTKHYWKIKNPTTIGPTGHANTISPTEATLNWQSENAVAQNKVLVKILLQEQRRLKPSTKKEPTFSQESQSIIDVVSLTKTPDVLPIQKANPVSMFLNSLTQTDKPQNPQFVAPFIKPQKDYEEFDNVESFEHLFIAEPENAESIVQFDAEDYEEHQENPNQETLTEFLKLQGRLRDWYHSLGKYHQLQIQQSISPEAFMSIIYSEFIGSPWECTAHAREEFLKMKYCFYYLNGVDDVNLKQVFLNSFTESLGNEAYQALEARNVTIAQTTLGELY